MIGLLLTVYTIARVLQGEVGSLGPEAAYLVATTMAQRQASGDYGDTWREVLDGYYADAPATAASIAVAWTLVRGRVPSVGFEWAYSADDVERMGWRRGDVVLTDGILELHLSRREPWS